MPRYYPFEAALKKKLIKDEQNVDTESDGGGDMTPAEDGNMTPEEDEYEGGGSPFAPGGSGSVRSTGSKPQF
jgi:hypothetical protein